MVDELMASFVKGKLSVLSRVNERVAIATDVGRSHNEKDRCECCRAGCIAFDHLRYVVIITFFLCCNATHADLHVDGYFCIGSVRVVWNTTQRGTERDVPAHFIVGGVWVEARHEQGVISTVR